ncbi:YbbR-like domain-containing protein [Oceanobacillus bengalensis]|uniref:YbbR-like domain-containing protein n=1 Tax=Oceanobacillus bengalensis TaxID=1435466 RepID=A0A494YT21_9BACI|nr:CdaR family protein [Oceanobacillus bengalensis]RKQ13249.1 hypothetical protein D8M05_16825 [Oceanobacillus bengalensis]
MDNWFKSKWFVRFAALAFAIVLYVFVDIDVNSTGADSNLPGRSSETQQFDDVPVQIKIDSENYVVTGVPEYVSVTLSGSPSTLRPIVLQRNFDVYVDLEGLEEGEHTVEIKHDITDELEVFIEPKTIDIYIEERATEQFEISAEFFNQDKLPQGYELGEFEITPSEVTITSSRRIIDGIGVVKVFVDLTGLEESINNREVPVNVYDSQGNELNVRIEPETVVVSAEINNPSKTVSLNIPTTGELPEGYSLTSLSANVEEVEAFAVSNVLEGIEMISTEEINLSEITETGTLEVDLSLPEGVNVPDVETIEVMIELEQTLTFEGLPIEVDGIQDGQAVTFLEPEDEGMDITAVGNEIEIRELTNEDFRISINVEGLDPGEYMLPVEIEGPDLEEAVITPEYDEIRVQID